MIDWKKYPKAKYALVSFYDDSEEVGRQEITRPAQPKTVADAVEWHKSKGWGMLWANENRDCITYGELDFAFADSENRQPHRQLVCTRAEFEAYVKEQEAEKWTYTYSDYGVRKDCILIHDKPDIHGQVLVLNRYDEYVLTGTVELKPIKPTIDKSQAWVKMQSLIAKHGITNAYHMTKQQYEII